MALTVFTINGTDYLSYSSVQEADAFLAVDVARSTAWNASTVTTEIKQARLVLGARLTDSAGRFTGEPIGGTTKNAADQDVPITSAWPRNGATRYGEPISVTLPMDIVHASIFLAGTVVANPSAVSITTQTSSGRQVKRVEGGDSAVEFFENTSGQQVQTVELVVPDQDADKLIRPYLSGVSLPRSGAGRSGRGFSFGTNAPGGFNDPNRFGVI